MFSVSSSSDKMSTSEQRITGTEETKLEKLKGDDLIWGRFSSINKIICDLNILLPVIWGIGSQMPTFPKNSMWQTMERCGKKGPWSQLWIPSPDTPKSTWAKGVSRGSPRQWTNLPRKGCCRPGGVTGKELREQEVQMVSMVHIEEVTTRRSGHPWFSDRDLVSLEEHPLSSILWTSTGSNQPPLSQQWDAACSCKTQCSANLGKLSLSHPTEDDLPVLLQVLAGF